MQALVLFTTLYCVVEIDPLYAWLYGASCLLVYHALHCAQHFTNEECIETALIGHLNLTTCLYS
jgi:hypothetical protein